MSCHSAPIEEVPVLSAATAAYWRECGAEELRSVPTGMQNGVATWKTAWQFLVKLNTVLPYHPATVLLGVYPHKNLHMGVDDGFTHNCQNLEATMMSFCR